MFDITANKGFHLSFANGNTISVQWGNGNYCDNYNSRGRYGDAVEPSLTAEVMAWNSEEKTIRLEEGEEVIGHCSPEMVARYIAMVAIL